MGVLVSIYFKLSDKQYIRIEEHQSSYLVLQDNMLMTYFAQD